MLTKRICLLLLLISVIPAARFSAQSQYAIVLNEYSGTNVQGPTDFWGGHSDWVEIRNAHTTSVSLSGYYLSNDRNNLYKWAFPSNFTMLPGELKPVWLTGRNTTAPNGEAHANFTLDQCREEWLILTTSTGVVRDSVYVQRSMADHTRGRIDNTILGIGGWRVFTQHSFLMYNPTLGYYRDYAPTPQIIVSSYLGKDYKDAGTKGGFYDGPQILYMRLNGQTYDTASFKCFNIFYTVSDGNTSDYPMESYPATAPSVQYYDSVSSPVTIPATSIVRAIAVPNQTNSICQEYLPSFCETNTYYIDPDHLLFDKNFQVVSLAFDYRDTSWFTFGGNPPPVTKPTTIHIEYYENKKQLGEGYAAIYRPPEEIWRTKQKGFYVNLDDRRGYGCPFTGNIFNVEALGTSERRRFETLHLYAGDVESHSTRLGPGMDNESYGTGLRDIFFQSLAAKNNLKVNPLHIKPAVVLKTGKYWGAFNWKEVYDKYYESFYNGQFRDSLDLNFVLYGSEGHVTYPYIDGSKSKVSETWRSDVYDVVMNFPMNSAVHYDKVFSKLDKESFIDYMIVNSYALNSLLWDNSVAFGKGLVADKPGGKWHYYLWQMPMTLTFTQVPVTSFAFQHANHSPCYVFDRYIQIHPSALAYNGHGNILRKLMTTVDYSKQACGKFQDQFKNRYMDLLNGPLSCKEILKHFDALYDLYVKEMRYHELPGSGGEFFVPTEFRWDSLMAGLRKVIDQRCYTVENYFSNHGCFGMPGPFPISVDVRPAGAGYVKLNTRQLDVYRWEGRYYTGPKMSFKAIPSSTVYAFHHWEFKNHTPNEPLSMDSVTVNSFSTPGDEVVAVFTDVTRDILPDGDGSNIPTAFSPNGDGLNDDFRPLGAGEFAREFDFSIYNRWGQEVFRSTDPKLGWDGQFKGQPAVTGVYAYVISYRNTFGEQKLVKGNVTLTR